MQSRPYEYLPEPPDKINASTIMARWLDGMIYRYRWSLEGLDNSYMDFKPADDCRSLKELMVHIDLLARWLYRCIFGEKWTGNMPDDFNELMDETLSLLIKMRDHIIKLDESELENCRTLLEEPGKSVPFWYLINGPLADVLTHTGQICSWRRMAGNPIPEANVFRGVPPQANR